MIQITIGNSYSKITGLTAKQEKDLQNELSYTVGGSSAYFSGFGIKRRTLLDKRGNFPTGLLGRLQTYLLKHKLPHATTNRPIPPWPGLHQANPYAYNWQNAAVTAAYTNSRGSIRAPTGTGKSRAMAMIADNFKLKTLWIVPSLEIKAQTIAAWGHLGNVTITNIDDPKLTKMTDFDMLLIDECHKAAAKRYHKLNKTAWAGIYYRYSFSATTFRNDPEETLLYEAICGKEIYTLSYTDAVTNKYIVPLEAYYIEAEKQEEVESNYHGVYQALVVNNTSKNMQIAKLLTSLNSSHKSTLCLVKEIDHGKILQDLTGIPFVSGQDEDSRKYIKRFNEGALKTLIGTTGILSEGVDTKPCEYVIIAGSGKAKSQFMQACGRCLRNFEGKESGKVILIKDRSHKYLLRHFNTQVKILKEEYGILVRKLEL